MSGSRPIEGCTRDCPPVRDHFGHGGHTLEKQCDRIGCCQKFAWGYTFLVSAITLLSISTDHNSATATLRVGTLDNVGEGGPFRGYQRRTRGVVHRVEVRRDTQVGHTGSSRNSSRSSSLSPPAARFDSARDLVIIEIHNQSALLFPLLLA